MTPNAGVPSAGLTPLPPVGNAPSGPSQNKAQGTKGSGTDLMSGIVPVKNGVDSILAACKQIVASRAIPGAPQVCEQIIALAVSLLPMAAQQAMMPGAGPGPQAGPGGPGPGIAGPPAPIGIPQGG